MPTDQFGDYLQTLTAEYRASLGEKLQHIDSLWQDCRAGRSVPLRELQRQLHSIAGAAGTFGMSAVGEAAGAAESFLGPHCAAGTLPDTSGQAEFEGLLVALRQSAGRQ